VDEALRDLAPRWQRYWPDADVERIVADVRDRMAAALEAWDIPDAEPLSGGVGALTCAAGDIVVKVLPRFHPEEAAMRGEAEALVHWRDTGAAVPLLGRRDDGITLLLRRLRPASTLDDRDYDEQLVIAGELVARLHAAGPPPESLPSIETYVEPYRRLSDPELDRLLAGNDHEVAVHADLHGGNVLRDGDRWVAIDPKGVRGDPHLDVWLLLCPQAPPLPDDNAAAELRRRIGVYCDAARLDPQRAAAWVGVIARAEAVLCADSAFSGWVERLERIAAASREPGA
jgi:streptomycin 6-kinase